MTERAHTWVTQSTVLVTAATADWRCPFPTSESYRPFVLHLAIFYSISSSTLVFAVVVLFWPDCTASGILAPQPRLISVPRVKVQSLNLWTARKAPGFGFFFFSFKKFFKVFHLHTVDLQGVNFCCRAVTQLYLYIFFFMSFSIMLYCRILTRGPCAIG